MNDDFPTVRIPVERCREGALLPRYAREGDAGMDICAAEDITILPGQTALVPTGLKFAVPPGYEIQVRPRSGISLRTSLRIPNAPGTVDSGYREEVGVIMTNTRLPENVRDIDSLVKAVGDGAYPTRGLGGPEADGPCAYSIKKGDRIAQIVVSKLPSAELFEVGDINEYGPGRQGGFGSTGI